MFSIACCSRCFFIFLAVVFAISLLYKEARSDVPDALARFDMNLEVFLLVYRILAAILSIFISCTSYDWVLLLFYTLSALAFFVYYLTYQPFYNPIISYLYGTCMCIYFWIALNFLVVDVFDVEQYTCKVMVVGMAVIVVLMNDVRNRLTRSLIFLLSSIFNKNERMKNRYFSRAYNELLNLSRKDLIRGFSAQNTLQLILLVVFTAVNFLIYFFIWTYFIASVRNSLWVTKCMLGILPINVVLEVGNIKKFLVNSSDELILNMSL
eukprot:TRINITY_DN7297_c0_g2_i5.p2 TRINITY_DN7297_c0_g2~~TRINITY_DN7297_c0_g2_i5.p2  ORF type:complete len:266 (+),score=25.88 TRINITY_DN7297_c0_g2_i5:641-1438(+)